MSRSLATALLAVLTASLAAAATPAARAVPSGTPKEKARVLAPPADSAAVMALLDGVTNRACPLPGVATGGQPAASHLQSLAKAGYRTVLDLRAAEESRGFDESAAMRAAGLEYVLLPVTHESLTDGTFDAFRRLMQEKSASGVFVHCASGNRVGAVMVPWLVLDRGWSLERAVAAARAGGLRSPDLEGKARDYVAKRRAAR